MLAAFALGTGVGLLVFGELGARYRVVDMLVGSLIAFSLLSIAVTLPSTLVGVSVIRFFQGIAAAAPAVYAPVMVKRLYSEQAAVAMIGRIGSIESMAPAIAPILGAVLLSAFGWRSSFYVVAFVCAVLTAGWLLQREVRESFARLERAGDGYRVLLCDARFIRYALSQACTLAAILVIVFSAPKILTSGMGGQLSDFIVMQVAGITFFVVAANMSGRFVQWWGAERTILIGSAVSMAGCVGILIMALLRAHLVPVLWALFIFVNLGLGIRGPVGFYKALVASGANESRGSALVIFFVMVVTAAGTAVVARYIESGLFPLAVVASVIAGGSVLALLVLPGIGEGAVTPDH